MKNLIVLMGIISFATVLVIFQTDFNKLHVERQQLKFIADEALSSASLELDLEEYSEGYLIYDDEKVVNKIEQIFALNGLDKDLNYQLIIYDEKGIIRSFGTGKLENINKITPCLQLSINIGKPNFRSIKCQKDIYVVSEYEYKGF